MMKILFSLSALLLLASCSDAMRTRTGNYLSSDGQSVECSKTSQNLETQEFRKKYIAEVTTQIQTTHSKLTLLENVRDVDFDQDLSCELSIEANKKFSYIIQGGKLILTDGLSTMVFTKSNGSLSEILIGSWSMEENVGKVQTITEIILRTEEEMRIRKTCNLK
jgi:hypothetical protein